MKISFMGGTKCPLAKNYQRDILKLAASLDKQENDLFKSKTGGIGMYQNFKSTFDERIKGNYFLAIADDENLAGMIWVKLVKNEYREPTLLVGDVIVAPSFRGKGVATMLMDAAKVYAQNTGCTSITLNVLSNNAAAKTMYAKLGFMTVSENQILKL